MLLGNIIRLQKAFEVQHRRSMQTDIIRVERPSWFPLNNVSKTNFEASYCKHDSLDVVTSSY